MYCRLRKCENRREGRGVCHVSFCDGALSPEVRTKCLLDRHAHGVVAGVCVEKITRA